MNKPFISEYKKAIKSGPSFHTPILVEIAIFLTFISLVFGSMAIIGTIEAL